MTDLVEGVLEEFASRARAWIDGRGWYVTDPTPRRSTETVAAHRARARAYYDAHRAERCAYQRAHVAALDDGQRARRALQRRAQKQRARARRVVT